MTDTSPDIVEILHRRSKEVEEARREIIRATGEHPLVDKHVERIEYLLKLVSAEMTARAKEIKALRDATVQQPARSKAQEDNY
jgi:hypothetical protein